MSYAKEEDKEESKEVPVPPKDPDQKSIFEYLEKIIDALNAKEAQVAHHLDRIATAVEKIAKSEGISTTKPVSPPPPSKPTPTPIPAPISAPTDHLKELMDLFPNDLQELLTFEDKGDWVKVAPRRFLGSDNFAKIASIIRDAGGEYISAGKASHFKVAKK